MKLWQLAALGAGGYVVYRLIKGAQTMTASMGPAGGLPAASSVNGFMELDRDPSGGGVPVRMYSATEDPAMLGDQRF